MQVPGVGLPNPGSNSCWVNSALQVLVHLDELREALLDLPVGPTQTSGSLHTAHLFKSLLDAYDAVGGGGRWWQLYIDTCFAAKLIQLFNFQVHESNTDAERVWLYECIKCLRERYSERLEFEPDSATAFFSYIEGELITRLAENAEVGRGDIPPALLLSAYLAYSNHWLAFINIG